MRAGRAFKHPPSLSGDMQLNDTLVTSVAHAADQFAFDERIHEIASCRLMQRHTL